MTKKKEKKRKKKKKRKSKEEKRKKHPSHLKYSSLQRPYFKQQGSSRYQEVKRNSIHALYPPHPNHNVRSKQTETPRRSMLPVGTVHTTHLNPSSPPL
jgi:hypothetical protein